ncbi:protein phosphatase 2C domain-containing protein [Asanoa sp. WMMD1127]|uniref:PP2C family protein-serine/threonine phosphatase n=1 Tax=Asanoa sp. WMMD1127 TaxID=3016107 RepID=UPI002417D005|nr:protein phosphatase 2C domain-containing protein [Asanoa sp. WMMD1127]MDG4824271.1 protein phosphatase 2C domain-containing protein [Asanoa sp. WMMD1127]
MTLVLRSVALTDRGLVRRANQDAVYAGNRLLAVADGMGGMAAGDLASAITIDAVARADADHSEAGLVDAMRHVIDAASVRIRSAVAEDPTRDGMGTTLTALLFAPGNTALVLAHVGDSRAYLLRDGVTQQMTKDDTFVQMLVDEGVITPDEAHVHPRRAVVTQALQGEPVSPSFTTMVPEPGDRWLLCSDGLSNVVREDTIAEVLRTIPDRGDCAARLVDLARRAGGPDNITVIVADLEPLA